MSAPVRLHEPVCFDNMQNQFYWIDHFLGDQIKDEWASGGTGSAVVVDQEVGGIVRLTTGASAGNTRYLFWNNIRTLLMSKRVSMEVRAKVNQSSALVCYIALMFDWDNFVRFAWNAVNWSIVTEDDGAGSTTVTTGIATDTSYHRFRMQSEILGGSHIHLYIDGVQTANSPRTTNIPIDANDYLQPYLHMGTSENVAKSMDVDYVVVRQDI